jgi:hypothetical protein
MISTLTNVIKKSASSFEKLAAVVVSVRKESEYLQEVQQA